MQRPQRCTDQRGDSLSQKRIPPLEPPEKGLGLAVSGLNNSDVSEVKVPRARRCRISVAIRFDLLLLSAAALPVSWQCSLITVYRCTHQCGERSNAAFGRQSAAEQTSLAPHDSRRGCKRSRLAGIHGEAMYTAPTLRSACSSSSHKLPMCRVEGTPPRPFSWGCKGDILFPRKRISPFAASPHGVGPEAALPRCTPCALRAQKETALAGCFPPAPEARKLSKLSIWDTYPHFPSFFFG